MAESEDTIITWNWFYLALAVGAALCVAGIGWVTFNTVINHLQIIGIVAGFGIISYFPLRKYFRKHYPDKLNILILLCLFGSGPFFGFVFFGLNAAIPITNSFTEKIIIQSIQTTPDEKGTGTKSIVTLQNNKYNEYRSIRTFYSRTFTEHDKFIIFTFRRGLFGIKQLKDTGFAKE